MKANDRQINTFLNLLVKLNPIEFAGFCKVMGVQMVNEEKDPLPAQQLINELLNKYYHSDRQKRRRILRVLRTAGGVQNGTYARVSKENK